MVSLQNFNLLDFISVVFSVSPSFASCDALLFVLELLFVNSIVVSNDRPLVLGGGTDFASDLFISLFSLLSFPLSQPLDDVQRESLLQVSSISHRSN
jgi:hypothetical protein